MDLSLLLYAILAALIVGYPLLLVFGRFLVLYSPEPKERDKPKLVNDKHDLDSLDESMRKDPRYSFVPGNRWYNDHEYR
jgi:hypothetical protein